MSASVRLWQPLSLLSRRPLLCLCRFRLSRNQYPECVLAVATNTTSSFPTSWYVPSFSVILTTIDKPKLTFPFCSSSTYHCQPLTLSLNPRQPYIVNLHLPQRARPAIEPKHLICQCYRLIPLQIRHLAASIARSLRNVLGPKLSIEPALQRRDFLRRKAAHDAFLERVLDVAARVLVA